MQAGEAKGITTQAAQFAASVTFNDIPKAAHDIGRRCIIDGLGLFVAGLSEESVNILIGDAKEQGGKPEALLLGAGSLKVPASLAARILGIAGHAHDWDDTQVSFDPAHIYGLLTHPTIPPLAAALAMCQRVGKVSGRDFLTAFHAGFEVECKISEWMLPHLYKRSFHSSGVVGIFGACIAASKLLGLNEARMRSAIGIAASMAAGLRVNFGTMTKPLHVGRAAENGVTAAIFAQRGFDADPNALDGPWGYCRAYADGVTPEKLTQGIGKSEWTIVTPGVSIKPYPSGILTHQAMDGMLQLVTRNNVTPDQIETIDFYAGSNILNPIRYPVAQDHLQAKFSMAALLSMIALRRQAGPNEFTNEFVRGAAMQEMQRRITTHLDPEIEAQGTEIIRSRIEMKLKSGQTIVERSPEAYRGGPNNPFSDADLRQKFGVCAEGRLDAQRQSKVIEAVNSLESVSDAGGLAALIQSH
jgi:2-methylcitrate dehydratase PrpD